jgi:co-chaperonin GroES (HSP10)
MTKAAFSPHKISRLRALHDWVLVEDMNFDERITTGGIILTSDDGKGTGIRPRWGRIYATGPEQKFVQPGQWILVAHGRWTRGVEIEDSDGEHTIRRVDPNDIMLVSDERPSDDTMSDAIHIDAKSQ